MTISVRGSTPRPQPSRHGLPSKRRMWQDVRYALRLLIRAPGFALVSVLTLALGIGANTAIFSVVRGVLLAPLPFADPDRLVAIWHGYPPAMPRAAVSAPGFYDLQEPAAREIFSDVATFSVVEPEPHRRRRARAARSSCARPRVFSRRSACAIAAGRWFAPEEDVPGDSSVVVLSDGLWRRRFGGDRRVVGQTILASTIGRIRSSASWRRRRRFRSSPMRGCRSRSRRRSARRRTRQRVPRRRRAAAARA